MKSIANGPFGSGVYSSLDSIAVAGSGDAECSKPGLFNENVLRFGGEYFGAIGVVYV